MTKEEFKERWQKEDGDGLTFDDIAKCAIEWRLCKSPRTQNMTEIGNKVLVAAGLESYWSEQQ